jgi:phosphatidylglycerol:prolipoprotein diacylglycerol transferase
VRGVPTSFHLGPLVFHTYGFGLAIAAYVAYLYARRRLERAGVDVVPFARYTGWLLVAGLIGARAANIATNWSYYDDHLGRWFAVWQGGLASFGGIALALVVGLILQRRWWPGVRLVVFTDALIPALVAGWALGRVLGPQFMVDGGGHLTHSWIGISYAGQAGKRVPVPLIQGAEDGALWLGLLALERTWVKRSAGVISAVGMMVWGLVRTFDEHYLLGQESHSGSVGVQIAGLALAAAGLATLLAHFPRRARDDTPRATLGTERASPTP